MVNQEKKEIAKIIHKAEYPNSFCWDNCNKCPGYSNCYYLKAAEALIAAGWHREEMVERK